MRGFRRKRVVVQEDINANVKEARPIGITIPFNNPSGIFHQSYTNKTQVYSNLRNLLLTAKGERYMLPDFGTDIRFVLFENIVDEESFKQRISGEIEDAITTWMPYISIQEMNIQLNVQDDGRVNDSSHAVGIKFTVVINGTNIYLPVEIFISDVGNLRIEEAIYNG